MVLRTALVRFFRPLHSSIRLNSTTSPATPIRRTNRIIPLGLAFLGSTTLFLTLPSSPLHTQDESKPPINQLETSSRLPSSPSQLSTLPTTDLLRAYFVWTLTSFPPLIDSSPTILYYLTHSPVPGLKSLTESIVRYTFFRQFVPGETVGECRPCMEEMRRRNVGSVLNYSAEAEVEVETGGDGKEGVMKRLEKERLQEVVRALDEAGEFEREMEREGWERGTTAFALKITGLIDPQILTRASTCLLRYRPLTQSNSPSSPLSPSPPTVPYPRHPIPADERIVARPPNVELESTLFALKGGVPEMGVLDGDEGLRKGDMEELGRLWGDLKMLGERARSNGVKLMIDAEHTWYQPALDAYTLLLQMEFNKPQKGQPFSGPLIYGTYQCYLTRQPTHLAAAIQHAEKNGYALGIKLVRGAYFVAERKKWKDEHRPGADPIWPDKPATDEAYNASIQTILSTLAKQVESKRPELALSVVFGTHNPASVDLVIEGLESQGLAKKTNNGLSMRKEIRGKVCIAQLYGMKDDLTDKVLDTFEPSKQPISLRYVAYGKLSEVMPFLGRRAIENKSVMSGEGGAAAERRRIGDELWRRVFG